MRYYHPFPEAIPLSEAGYSRVTHPSATKNIKQAQCSPFDLHVLSVPPAFVLSQDQTLYLSCIYRRCRVFISILAITIRSQLPLWFFRLFWLLKVPISWNLKGFFACSALFNFQDTFEAVFCAATFTLYHIQKFLSSKQFVNWSSTCFSLRSFSLWPAFLFYHILSILSSKQFMNWSSSIIFFPFSSTACPKQLAYSFYHTFTVLSSELFLNKFRSPLSISRSVLSLPFIPLFHSTPALVRQLYYYIMLFSLCQVKLM